uniref:Uncharacterized protein n=1 Tax=Marseillevirus LCMAC103 TaxID=2506604 RepID=A0A481YW62_9VIRU|nr:MAG: uncharacterized protein LCMAC103_03490 [Marseillevirus LCMAC103]
MPHSSGIEQPTKKSGFRPELYTVLAGGYAGGAPLHTPLPAAGAAMVETYWTEQFQNGTTTVPLTNGGTDFLPGIGQCTWSQGDGWVTFEMILTLDKSPTGGDPITTAANEIRIRPFVSGVAGEPPQYRKRLPQPDQNYPMPVFDVAVYTKADIVAGPFGDGTSAVGLKAHMLVDSTLALVIQPILIANGSASVYAALVHTDLGAEFTPAGWVSGGAGSHDQMLRFIISGSYKANTGSNALVQ